MKVQSVSVGPYGLSSTSQNTDVPIDKTFSIAFSTAPDTTTIRSSILIGSSQSEVRYSYSLSGTSLIITPRQNLLENTVYQLNVSSGLKSASGKSCTEYSVSFTTASKPLTIISMKFGATTVSGSAKVIDVPRDLNIEINFSAPLLTSSISGQNVSVTGQQAVPLTFSFSDNNKKIIITSNQKLIQLYPHKLMLSTGISGANQEKFSGTSQTFYTAIDPTPKFPVITDDQLLTKIQQQTFKYFWDFGHPVSGMARERNTSGDVVTTGGSGFGIMSIIVAIERGFITRTDGIQRLGKIVSFLESADKFHGAWPHWMNGNTGRVIPFSTKDNGGDLVETSFMIQGLLTFRQYLNSTDATENDLIQRINVLWQGVEWDWYRKNNQEVLYWHWSPDYNWAMNFPMYGYFEEQITYFLAAGSPTHSIPKSTYVSGYALNGSIKTGNSYFGYTLPLGTPSPLFWVQYSYLGMDPHFSDDYANYWQQNVNASLINHAYCVSNPKGFVGYSDDCWGLTSSDNQNGYDAQSPSNDLGVITPTAALSSFPYSPAESMKAAKFFYYTLGDRLWGDYGFYDAFNITEGWTASSYLAIDQGPIIVMIENYRTGLLWNLFMTCPEVSVASSKLGITR